MKKQITIKSTKTIEVPAEIIITEVYCDKCGKEIKFEKACECVFCHQGDYCHNCIHLVDSGDEEEHSGWTVTKWLYCCSGCYLKIKPLEDECKRLQDAIHEAFGKINDLVLF
jgi:hypothetical protein